MDTVLCILLSAMDGIISEEFLRSIKETVAAKDGYSIDSLELVYLGDDAEDVASICVRGDMMDQKSDGHT